MSGTETAGEKSGQAGGGAMKNPWSVDAGQVVQELNVSPEQGLGDREVRERLQRYGENRIAGKRRKNGWKIMLEQFKSIIMLLLGAASALSFVFQQWVDGVAIAVAMIINAGIGFVTELRATRSMEALQKMSRMEARVRRGGGEQVVPAENLVPGDVVLVSSGDVIPADLRVAESNNLQVNESALTGESVPVFKKTGKVEEETVLAERVNMLFKGTAVTMGSGEGVVTATGMDTELGNISEMVQEAETGTFPLERRLDKLGRNLVYVVIAIASVAGGVGVLVGKDLFLMIETAIALMVAAVPEGLPIVATLALARGMHRMAKRNALVRKLESVETLGSTTAIFTDKTGTLTENRMSVTSINGLSGSIEIGGKGPDGGGGSDGGEGPDRGGTPDIDSSVLARRAVEIGVLCNNASLSGQGDHMGDPMEVALLELGDTLGVDRDSLLEEQPEEREVAFNPDKMMMATFHKTGDGFRVAVKGAAERVLEACERVFQNGEWVELTGERKKQLLDLNQKLAEQGLRMLAFAEKTADSAGEEPYRNLGFLAIMGLLDPPREQVRDSIDRCEAAGINVVMVTGDQEATARKVAQAVGLGEEGQPVRVVHGSDLKKPDEMSEEERKRSLQSNVFVRVSPEQKLRLIGLYQEAGAIVAMTGDGVNDAPALKKANIGIAMGKRGQQVAKEAADVILQDDSFHTITVAVEHGRAIFNNIRRFVIYLLSGNIGEILIVTAGVLLGTPIPLLPLQILYLNAINDAFPALALGLGEAEQGIMRKPPRDPEEPILKRSHWWAMTGYGGLIAASVLGGFLLALWVFGLQEQQAVTVSFLSIAFSRLWHVFNMKDVQTPLLRNQVTANKFVWGALGLCVVLILLAVYVPGLSDILGTARLPVTGWLLVGGWSFVPLILGQVAHLIARRHRTG